MLDVMAEKRRVRVDVETGKPVSRPDFGTRSEAIVREEERAEAQEAEEALVDDPGACSCPRPDPEDWHEVESDWSDITFVKTSLPAAMGVPLSYQSARIRLEAKAAGAGYTIPDDAMVLLGTGRFRRPLMLEVEDVPEDASDVVRPGGVVYTRMVPAPMGEMKKVVSESLDKAKGRYGRKPDGIWLWYLTCRVCSAARNFETMIVAHYRK
jgi:hypothetical protein